ncbi:methyl-accepting chemotaxis sensory transducer with TarH sensor [Modicisalibacter xianhensis]|uniref:Methyl-accepting chemotaxis sensory transducer with TarH sensor n=1 Tax=Modicisalibacter xianhensis TaxID=442341 RepID=A0A4V6QAS3_9GAMM|nr:methyl-accepting chemotaxis protein [Halomonas xianhensis]TDX28459.1 methyl-accepting chemotaxis sensory transducer with TarH sensor [Halomonas xianhensis]
MKLLDNMTVRFSWMLVLAAFSCLLIVVGTMGLYSNHFSRQAFGTLNQPNVEQTSALNRAYIDMLRARVEMDRAAELIRAPSFDRPGPVIEQAGMLLNSADAAFERFLAVPSQPGQQEAIAMLTQRFQSLLNTGLSLQLMVLEDADFSGYRSGQTRVSEMSQAFIDSADTFFQTSQRSGNALVSRFQSSSGWMDRAIVMAVILALVLIGTVLWGVTRNVIRPLRRLGEHFERIAQGDLSAIPAHRSRNEIGKLYQGLGKMQQSLATTVARVRSSSQEVHDGAHHIANGNEDLSSRTEQQSATLVETASSMDELTSTVSQNADNARQASRVAANAAQTAHQGGVVIGDVIDTMQAIDHSARQVNDIIGVIDEIAFQTNILALNASVEAARAGEQGRGFAVVAGEVRALAGRSAKAASQVRALLQASSEKVANGTALVDRAGKTMQEIVTEIQRVNAIMEEIAAASSEQSLGIGQVNQAIGQMERATQQNTHLVLEAADASQTLERAAAALRHSVAHFHLAEDGGNGAETLPPTLPAPDAKRLPTAEEARSVSLEPACA